MTLYFFRLEFQVVRIRELEEYNMNRKVSGPRKAYVKTFNEWMEKNGAKIEGVGIADFGNQGLNKVPNKLNLSQRFKTKIKTVDILNIIHFQDWVCELQKI